MWDSRTGSRIQPFLKVLIQPLQHLLSAPFGVGELRPASDVSVLSRALKFVNEFLDEHKLIEVLLSKMLFAQVCGLLLSMFGS
jgi:hypothetical protein